MLSTPRSITTIFFDLGFTLLNFEGDFARVMSESYLVLSKTLIGDGCKFDARDFTSRIGQIFSDYYRLREIDLIERPLEGYLRKCLEEYNCTDLPETVIQNAINRMYLFTEKHWVLEPDAHEVLRELTRSGYKLGMISNAANAQDVNQLIDVNNLRRYFKAIIISAEEKIRKPHIGIFHSALKRIEALPENTVMIGDTLIADIQGAKNSGMRAIWFDRRGGLPSFPDSLLPDAMIRSLSEIPAVLQTLQ